MPNAKLGAKVDRYSFFVRLLPPPLHTGLARRTNIAIALIDARRQILTERTGFGSYRNIGRLRNGIASHRLLHRCVQRCQQLDKTIRGECAVDHFFLAEELSSIGQQIVLGLVVGGEN